MSEHAAPVQTVQAPVPQSPQANTFHLQRKCACGTYDAGGECNKCRNDGKKLQRVAINDTTANSIPSIVSDVLGSSGQPLDTATRTWIEPRLGQDFSNVRVHTDARAAQSAQAVNALAYTVGRDVVFGAGQYAPATEQGSRLLAHELTHVVQQAGAGTNSRQTKMISEPSDAAEVEADDAASKILSGEFVPVTQSPTATLHAQLSPAEVGGIVAGSVGAAVGIGLGIAYLAGAFDGERSVRDLPSDLIARLQPACQPNATAVERQAAIDALVTWARRQSSFGIDWSKVDSVRYDTAVGAQGSQTNADDPNHITVKLGPVAFSSVPNLYSTFRHELVHVQEHQTRPRSEILARGQGVQEIYAYLWELEHQNETGLARRENWGLTASGTADVSIGLARVVDGLLRGLSAMSTDLQSNPSMIPMAEQVEIERRVACAMTQTPREVVQAVLPRAPLDLWQRECAEGVMTPQTKLSSHANARLAVSSPESAAEREADQVADRLSQGRTTPSIREVAPSATVHRSGNSFAGAGVIPAGAGMPLPLPAREFFETGFGHSFNDVRIHTDAPAARSALSLQAEAFTVGRDIYFGAGKFDPKSAGGRRLIAHELTHTIQQQGGAESVMRQATTPAPTAAAPAAENAGPGPYDGCPDPQPLIAARTDAGARVAHAIELLRPANLQSAAPLLAKHFHVDTSRPESQRAVASIRAQLGRMASGLNSGIRIFCRSTPRTSAGLGRSPMPPSSECHSTTNAYSTSCANNEASATVILCEGRIAEGGDYVVKTIIHEFAHIACNGDPDIQPAGAEVYYDASQGLPGNVPNVLTYADSYALFVMDASSVQVAATEQANTRQAGAGRSRLPWLAVLGVGVGLGIGGIFAPGLLLGAGLGLGIGIAGLAGAFE